MSVSCFSLRSCLGIALVVAGFAGMCAAEEPATKLKGWVTLIDDVTFASNVSEDKQAASVLFRDLTSNAEGKNIPVNVKKLTVELGVDAKEDTHLTQDIRGSVDFKGKSTATLLITANGKSTLVDLKKPYEQKKTPPKEVHKKLKAQLEAQFGPTKSVTVDEAGNFETRIEGTIAKGGRYVITFVLLTQTDGGDGAAFLSVTSLDLEMKKPAAK